MKNNQNNNIEETGAQAACCPKCGRGVELVSGIIPEHKVMASHQGTKAKICRGSGKEV